MATIQKVTKSRYGAKVDKENMIFVGADWFYGNRTVKTNTGIKAEKDLKGSSKDGIGARIRLVRLIAFMDKGTGNKKKTHRFSFLCDPSEAEKAIVKLPGTKVNRPKDTGYTIRKVYRPTVVSRR